MSSNGSAPAVVVGVDETPGGQQGVRYAALEAHRLGARLSVLHATPGYTSAGGMPSPPADVLRSYGLELLDTARETAVETVPGLEVETTLVAGDTSVQALTRSSRKAELVVLGAERRTFVGRIWTGDVVAGVAARAACPVVVVPPEWEPTRRHGRVVVGVKDSETAADLVDAGLVLADQLASELVVLHAWKAPSGYDDMLAERTYAQDYVRTQNAHLEGLVQAHRPDHPHVAVHIRVLHEQPAHALVRASEHADRLLVGRPRHGGIMHHLGMVARAVLNEARCPVEVHPATEHSTEP